MQLKVHLGEFAPTGVLAQPLILFGSVEPMNVRVDVDENDAWRVRASADAIGFLRGNRQINVLLKFVRFEPYVIPKVSLTGAANRARRYARDAGHLQLRARGSAHLRRAADGYLH